MLFSPRITLHQLAGLCRRLAISLESGLDVRRILEREETTRSSGALARNMGRVRREVLAGATLGEALSVTGKYFPPLFHELVALGEETGRTAETLRRLAEHYEHQVELRRQFLSSITWPAIQLAAAVSIVGALIWLMGVLPAAAGSQPFDILGFGLVGNRGLAIYLALVGAAAAAGYAVYQSARRGAFWTRPLVSIARRLPVLGPALSTLSLARLSWTLHLTLEGDMDLRRSIPLALSNCGSPTFAAAADDVVDDIESGAEVHEALPAHLDLPADFRDALEIGERSGKLPEVMGRLSRQYEERSKHALATLNTLAGFLVWALVAALIVSIIFRIAMSYVAVINDAARPNAF